MEGIEQPEPTTIREVSEYHTAEGVSCGTNDENTGPASFTNSDPSSSSGYLSAHDVVQNIERSGKEPNRELEREIEASKVHWSELSSYSCDSDGDGESNREIFEKLRRLPQYQNLLNIDMDVHSDIEDIVLGEKLAEGGQAEIFEVEVCRERGRTYKRYLLKVFKQGYSLRGLQKQWPQGFLSLERKFQGVVVGGLVLEDDRFAFLLIRCSIDLRKLIDVAQEDNSPLWEQKRRPLEEFRTYKPQTQSYGCSTPIFKDRCAQSIMYNIASGMVVLHKLGVLHGDLKGSNILCLEYSPDLVYQIEEDQVEGVCHEARKFLVLIADFESSIGVVGTAFWRAPEILQQLKDGKSRVHFTREADIYSFAMICYEILTGSTPFQGYETNAYDHVLNGVRPTLPNHVPSWLKDMVNRCWHQNPSRRPTFIAICNEMESHGIPPPNTFYVVLERPDKKKDLVFEDAPTNEEG